MSRSSSSRAPSAATPPRKTARPAHGVCRLTLTINGTSYSVKPIAADPSAALKAFRLKKSDGTTYDVAQTVHGLTCDCPDFVFHRDGRDPGGCKHIKALVACGVLATTSAAPAPSSAAGWPEWTDAERWALGPEPDDAPGFDPFDPGYVAEIRHEGGDA